jgi:hypothetical protein
MGRIGWLLVAVLALLFMTTARFHHLPGRFGERVSIEFVPPWR